MSCNRAELHPPPPFPDCCKSGSSDVRLEIPEAQSARNPVIDVEHVVMRRNFRAIVGHIDGTTAL
jgi:hypothetical protein